MLAHGQAQVPLRVDRFTGAAALGAGLLITRGRKVIVRRGLAVGALRGASRTLGFPLPKLARGRYTATVQIAVLVGTAPVRTATLTRRFALRLP